MLGEKGALAAGEVRQHRLPLVDLQLEIANRSTFWIPGRAAAAPTLSSPFVPVVSTKPASDLRSCLFAYRRLSAAFSASTQHTFAAVVTGSGASTALRVAVAPTGQEAGSQVQPLLDEKGLEIELDVGCELWVEADRRRLLQILWNLLSNAIRHTAAGGKLAIRCLGTEAAVEIAVSDSGVGMAADQLERIFEDYTQVGVRADGTGLGLPVSRRLAQLMGGDIGVVSQLGAGSSFTIILPAASPPKEDNP